MENRENQVNVKRAVKAAIDYVKDLYVGSALEDVLLEEVEFSEASDQWLVTIGFSVSETQEVPQFLIKPSQTLSRRYKVVNIDATTGKPVSMKIRAL